MSTLLAHGIVEPSIRSASGSTVDEQTLMGAAPCVFQNDPFVSYRIFLEQSAPLHLLFLTLAIIVCVSFIGVVSSIWCKKVATYKHIILHSGIAGILISVLLFGGLIFAQGERAYFGKPDSNHLHADLLLYAKGQKIDLSDPMYISSGEESLSNFAHLHDKQGSVMHVHSTGVTWRYALDTLGIGISDTCIRLGKEEKELCTSGDEDIHFFLNGKEIPDLLSKPINDLDKIVIILGHESGEALHNIKNQVTNNACLFSGKCPERGKLDDGAGCTSKD